MLFSRDPGVFQYGPLVREGANHGIISELLEKFFDGCVRLMIGSHYAVS